MLLKFPKSSSSGKEAAPQEKGKHREQELLGWVRIVKWTKESLSVQEKASFMCKDREVFKAWQLGNKSMKILQAGVLRILQWIEYQKNQ